MKQRKYLLTSRPHSDITCNEDLSDYIVENIGFTEENIEKYVMDNYKALNSVDSKDLSVELVDWLNNNDEIKKLCRIPINLELLCQVYEKLKDEENVSIVKLYKKIEEKFFEKVDQRLKEENNKASALMLKMLYYQTHEAYLLFFHLFAFNGISSGGQLYYSIDAINDPLRF